MCIIAKAEQKHQPQSRIIIDELSAFPRLEQGGGKLAENVGEMGNVLARYSARIVMHDLADELLEAIDRALATTGSAQQAALDRVRVLRDAMVKTKN